MRLSLLSLCLALGLGLTACSTHQKLEPTEHLPQGFAAWQDQTPVYRILPGDRLAVRYLKTPEIDEELPVLADGTVSFRTTGTLKAEGMTTAELEQLVTRRAGAKLLNDPVVSVAVTDPAASVVYMAGQVARPGNFKLVGRPGVLEAVAMAGGFTEEARMDEVVLVRRQPEGPRPMLRLVNILAFLEAKEGSGVDVPLLPGDIIFVPRSPIADTNLWIELFVNRTLPFNRGTNYNITRD